MFSLFEASATWPSSEQEVLTIHIPKADGGLRPIALFKTLYRVYAKCRAQEVRSWALKEKGYFFNNASGRWVVDSTWRNQVKSALGSEGAFAAEVLLDVKKAFENVNRTQLLQAAISSGYPLPALIMSL